MHGNKQVLWLPIDLKIKKACEKSHWKQQKSEELSHVEGKAGHSNWFWKMLISDVVL